MNSNQYVRRLLAHSRRSLRRSRTGSVLILVVALVLLLAVMGTAFISGSRTERYAAGQHTSNSQIDLVVQGLVNLVDSAVIGKLYDPTVTGPAGYRLLSNSTSSYSYLPYESSRFDLYLSPRIPEVGTVGTAASAANLPFWRDLSIPSFSRTTAPGTPLYSIDGPDGYSVVLVWNYISSTPPTKYLHGDVVAYTPAGSAVPNYYTPTAGVVTDAPVSPDWTDLGVSPKGVYVYYPAPKVFGGRTLPGMAILNQVAGGLIAPSKTPAPNTAYAPAGTVADILAQAVYAADADGDGIADSILQRFPFDQVDGITYFGAERVIDDSSAVNLNTALNSYQDYSLASGAAQDALGQALTAYPNNQQNLGMFASHVGLMQVLSDYNVGTLTSPQANGSTTQSNGTFLDTIFNTNSADPLSLNFYPGGAMMTAPYAYDDSVTPYSPPTRTDFRFTTKGDELNAMVARRLGNPGFRAATLRFGTYSISDGLSLAYHFCVENQSSGLSLLDTRLSKSISSPEKLAARNDTTDVGNASQPTASYDPSLASTYNWFNFNFNYAQGNGLPVRPLLVTTNAVSDFVSKHAVVGTGDVINPLMLPYTKPQTFTTGQIYASTELAPQFVLQSSALGQNLCFEAISAAASMPPVTGTTIDTTDWRYVPWTETPTKANVNTADFSTLFRAYANVMQDNPDSIPPQPGTTATIPYSTAGWGMFRSPSHLATGALTSGEMLQLRAALAAVNTIAMRSGDDQDVVSKTVPIFADAAHTSLAYNAQVFSVVKQPFIVAAVANFTGSASTQVSVEIFNPTDATISVQNWVLASISPTATTPTYTQLVQIPAGITIGPQQSIIFQGSPAANTLPGPADVDAPITAAGLENVATPGAEMEVVLLRPRAKSGGYSTSMAFDNTYAEAAGMGPIMSNLVPVDSLDFTNIFAAEVGQAGAFQRVYERAHSVNAGGYDWQEAYPGDYSIPAMPGIIRQIGWGPVNVAPVPVQVGYVTSDGSTEPANGANTPLYHPLQLDTTAWVGPYPISVAVNQYPFGAFARNGDILKVPFIGAYTLIAPGSATNVVAVSNPVTADAAMATYNLPETGVTPQQDEAVGRFCPLAALNPAQPVYRTGTNPDPYGWAAKVFDYLDVQVANDDYLPNVDPGLSTSGTFVYPTGGTVPVATAVPDQSTSTSNGTGEETLGHQGLININTAPAFVLQALPGVTAAMAQAIVADRELNGPFQTIFDLNRVQAGAQTAGNFQTGGGTSTGFTLFALGKTTTNKSDEDLAVANDPACFFGDLSPLNTTGKGASVAGLTDGVRGDFEERTLMINRISNLITTRSDMFTVYLDVQGWRNVGSVNPVIVSERRVAYKLDRNSSTQSNPTAITYPIPQN